MHATTMGAFIFGMMSRQQTRVVVVVASGGHLHSWTDSHINT